MLLSMEEFNFRDEYALIIDNVTDSNDFLFCELKYMLFCDNKKMLFGV